LFGFLLSQTVNDIGGYTSPFKVVLYDYLIVAYIIVLISYFTNFYQKAEQSKYILPLKYYRNLCYFIQHSNQKITYNETEFGSNILFFSIEGLAEIS